MWLGYGFKGGAGHFISSYEDVATAGDHREGMIRVSGVTWFTNLEIQKRHEDLILYKTYNPEEYPTYDTFEAINVDKTSDIPMDYEGIMGVPITFLDKYNPEQFEIIGEFNHGSDSYLDLAAPIIDGVQKYCRIAIRLKQQAQAQYNLAAEPGTPYSSK